MIDVSLIRRLAVHRGHPVVTSIYLDVDGRGAPRPSDIAPRQAALFREARRQAAERGEPVAAAVERDLQQADSWLAEHLERSSTRGVAFFSCAAQGWAQVVPLPVPVRDQVVLGPTPDVAQLAEAAAAVLQREPLAFSECDAWPSDGAQPEYAA